MKRLVLLLALVVSVSACASKAPPSLSPAGVVVWQANEVVVAIGLVQSAAINLNKVQVCDAAGACRPLLSDDNTRTVIDIVADGVTTIGAVPSGWKATGLSVVDRIDQRLDVAGLGKLKAYTVAARAVIGGL